MKIDFESYMAIHKKTGNKYWVIDDNANVKIDSEWHRAVIYCKEDIGYHTVEDIIPSFYCRRYSEFIERFEKEKTDGSK